MLRFSLNKNGCSDMFSQYCSFLNFSRASFKLLRVERFVDELLKSDSFYVHRNYTNCQSLLYLHRNIPSQIFTRNDNSQGVLRAGLAHKTPYQLKRL